MKNKKNTYALLAIVLFFSSGCASTQANSTKLTPTLFSIRNSVTQTPIPNLLPTETEQRSPTKIPPLAPSGLPPTWTPLPTYSADQARQVTIDLYNENPCRLPCWWGISPGDTSWLNAWQFLGQFAKNRPPWETLLLESKDRPGYIYYRVYLDIPKASDEEVSQPSNNILFIINSKTFAVDYIDLYTGGIETYSIANIFANYGAPQEIYIMGLDSPITSAVGLFFYYPQFGFISTHNVEVEDTVWREPMFTVCVDKVSTGFSLGSQENQLGFYERMKISGMDSLTISLIKPLEKVSAIDVTKFYEHYADYPCIELNTSSLFEVP